MVLQTPVKPANHDMKNLPFSATEGKLSRFMVVVIVRLLLVVGVILSRQALVWFVVDLS